MTKMIILMMMMMMMMMIEATPPTIPPMGSFVISGQYISSSKKQDTFMMSVKFAYAFTGIKSDFRLLQVLLLNPHFQGIIFFSSL